MAMLQMELYGTSMPDATHIAICTSGDVIGFTLDSDNIEEEYKEIITILTAQGKVVDRIETRRTYWWLPLDSYNQPNGFVEAISLFPIDYKSIKEAKPQERYPYWWIYDDEYSANYRAQD